jgi:hypothetical protein
MSAYGIDVFNFEFWDGPPPVVPTPKVIVTHRPGVSGAAHQILGTWGDTFDVSLTSHWASQLAAVVGHTAMKSLIGTGGKYLKYNNINWTSMYGTLYHVNAVEIFTLKSAPRLLGPGYDLVAGAMLVTKFTLTPERV